MEIGCMITEMKVCLMIFFIFFCQRYRTRVSAIGFSRVELFHHFYPKIDENAHFKSVFANIERFNRKTVNTVKFSIAKLRIPLICMHLQSKLTSEMCQKIGSLVGK